MNYDKVRPNGKAVSKSQYHFYAKVLDTIPLGSPRIKLFLDALDVDYDSLPDTAASSSRPQPQTQSQDQKLKLPPQGYATPLELYRHNNLEPDPALRDSMKNCGYIVYVSGVGHVGVTKDLPQKRRLKTHWRTMTVLTLGEVRSYFDLDENEPITTLRQAAELLASPAPAEPILTPPPAQQQRQQPANEMCPFCGHGGCDNNEETS